MSQATKTEVKHTPTKIKFLHGSWVIDGYALREDFIVRAVNSHEALLEAAKRALRMVEGLKLAQNDGISPRYLDGVKFSLDTAIVQAEKGDK